MLHGLHARFCHCLATGLLVSVFALQGCGGGGGDGRSGQPPGPVAQPPAISAVSIPVQTDDGWVPASLAEVNLSEQPLVDALNAIRRGTYNEIHGLVVIRNGRIVLEDYGRGRMYSGSGGMFTRRMDFDRDTLHIVHSVSKSFMSTLAGIAIRDGFIADEHQSVLGFFPEHAGRFDPRKEAITLRHLMSMSSGLEWNEWDVAALDFENSDAIRYQRAVDPSAYFFGKSLLLAPASTARPDDEIRIVKRDPAGHGHGSHRLRQPGTFPAARDRTFRVAAVCARLDEYRR